MVPFNDKCGVGVAYDSSIAGMSFLTLVNVVILDN